MSPIIDLYFTLDLHRQQGCGLYSAEEEMVIFHALGPFVVGNMGKVQEGQQLTTSIYLLYGVKEHYLMESLSHLWGKDVNKSLQLRFI